LCSFPGLGDSLAGSGASPIQAHIHYKPYEPLCQAQLRCHSCEGRKLVLSFDFLVSNQFLVFSFESQKGG
jgi:hypothetical protein